MTTPEQRELEHLRRLVAAYKQLYREAWLPVEVEWSEVKEGVAVLDKDGTARLVHEILPVDDGVHTILVSRVGFGPHYVTHPDPTATVRVLTPIPSDMTDLLLSSELGAACARVDEEA